LLYIFINDIVYFTQSLHFRRLRTMGNSSIKPIQERVDRLILDGNLTELARLIAAAETVYSGFGDLRDLYFLKGRLSFAQGDFSAAVEWYQGADRLGKNQLADANSDEGLEVVFHLLMAYAMQRSPLWRLRTLSLVWRIRKHHLFNSRRSEARAILLQGRRACRRITGQLPRAGVRLLDVLNCSVLACNL